MNHQKIYDNIIKKAKSENRIRESYYRRKKLKFSLPYYENHHIIPRCLNGGEEKENLVLLIAREHFVCHKLLTYIHPNNKKIACAFYLMSFTGKLKYNISSRDYEYAKELFLFSRYKKGTYKHNKIHSNKGILTGPIEALQGKKPWNRGMKMTKEFCENTSKGKIGKAHPQIYVKCEYCGIETINMNYKKYHGEKCKCKIKV